MAFGFPDAEGIGIVFGDAEAIGLGSAAGFGILATDVGIVDPDVPNNLEFDDGSNILTDDGSYILYDYPVLWTPESLTTTAWYDATDASTITESGGLVSQWGDKSGNDNHAVQATGAAQPTTGTTTIGGLNTLDFDGVDDTLDTESNPFGATVNDAFVFVVHKVNSLSSGSLFSLTGSEGVRWSAHTPWSDGTVYFDCGSPITERISADYGVSVGDNVLVGFYCSTTDNVQQIYKDGSLLVGDASGHSVSTIGNVLIASDSVNRQDTSIGEMIIINGTVDAATRQKVEGYLAHKWGLTLPVGHPYELSAPVE